MGIPYLSAFLKSCNCAVPINNRSNVSELKTLLRDLRTVSFDLNTALHSICSNYGHVVSEADAFESAPAVRKDVITEVVCQLVTVLSIGADCGNLTVLIAVDGVSPPGKRQVQLKRRQGSSNGVWSVELTSGSRFFELLFGPEFLAELGERLSRVFTSGRCRIGYILDSDRQPNEGEIKCLRHALKTSEREGGAAVIVSTDNDVIAASFMLCETHLIVYNNHGSTPFFYCNWKIKKLLFNDDARLCSMFGFLLLAIFGGDYLPPFLATPSAETNAAVYRQILTLRPEIVEIKLDSLLEDDEALGRVIRVVLKAFAGLSKHRRVLKKNQVACVREASDALARFFSDLAWVYGHYTCSRRVSPARDEFLNQSADGIRSFRNIPNHFYTNARESREMCRALHSRLAEVRLNATSEGCDLRRDWQCPVAFRNEVLPECAREISRDLGVVDGNDLPDPPLPASAPPASRSPGSLASLHATPPHASTHATPPDESTHASPHATPPASPDRR